MNRVLVSLAVFGLGVSTATAQTPGGSISSANSSTCTTVTLKSGEIRPPIAPTGTLPTARSRKAGEAARQMPVIRNQADGSTIVVDANGKCIIYRSDPSR